MNKLSLITLLITSIFLSSFCNDSLEVENPKGLKKRGLMKIKPVQLLKGDTSISGRSNAAITRVFMLNFPYVKEEYKKRLNIKESCKGEVSLKIATDYLGNVITSEIYKSTINDRILEDFIVENGSKFKFQKISNVNDTTEIIFHYIFMK